MKPILSRRNLIAVLITVGVLSFGTGVAKCETYGGGSGTAGDPYLIYTAEQMNTIGLHSEDWNKHFKLMADVDLSGYTGDEFNVIGYYVNSSSNKPFTGIFEGDGYEIVNFTYSSTETNYIGLFGYVAGKNAEIKDLGLINPNIAAGRFVGALVGLLEDYGTVTRCYVKNGSISGAGFNVGGLVGFLGGYYRGGEGTISYCYSSGSVYGKNSVGGLVGRNENGMISNCYSSASVSGSDVCFGGLVGWNSYDGTIANCYSTGKVLGLYFAGGLVEENLGTVSNSFWDIQTSGLTHSAGGTGKTTAEMQMKSTFTSAGWDFITPIWTIDDNNYPRLWWEENILYVPGHYPTIQAAIDACADCDVVLVADGIYDRACISGVFHKGRAITVRSENGPQNCIIDGGGEYGFWFYSTGTTPCRLEGFTLTNCQYDFGAIYCSKGSSPTITSCIMINNGNPRGAPHYRGIAGIRCFSRSSPTISNCVIVNNYFCAGNDSVGGGIFCKYSCNPTVKNCTIVGNTSCKKGGAIYCCSNCHIKITNCILWSNLPNEIFLEKESSASIVYSDVQNDLESVYVEQGSTLDWGEGNIDADPLFVAPDSNDYHLLPASPCIDAGDPNYIPEPNETDLDGNPRIIGGRIDMGAYETNYIEAAMKFTPQALNPGSKGNWVKAHFVLPEGFDVDDVDADTPASLEPFGIESDYINVFINEDGLVEIEIGFDRAAFCAGIDYGPAEVTVVGLLTSGQYFVGSDTIRIISGNLKYLAVFASHWLVTGCGAPDWCGGVDLDQNTVVDFVDFALFDGCCIEVVKE